MRRRIYTDYESSFLESRDIAYTHQLTDPEPRALYDEQLWDAYLHAEQLLREAREAVLNACITESYDEVERETTLQYEAELDRDECEGWSDDRIAAIERGAYLHNKSKEKPQ